MSEPQHLIAFNYSRGIAMCACGWRDGDFWEIGLLFNSGARDELRAIENAEKKHIPVFGPNVPHAKLEVPSE